MITQIYSKTARQLQTLTFSMGGPQPVDTGLLIVDVKGLGGLKSTVNTLGGVTSPGVELNYTKVNQRQIEITIILDGGATGDTKAGRELIRRHFPIWKGMTLGVVSGDVTYEIDAVVESVDINMFSRNENADITLMCPNPFFKKLPPNGGYLHQDGRPKLLTNEGDYPTPVIFGINFSGRAGDVTIQRLDGTQKVKVYMDVVEDILGRPIQMFDKIDIDPAIGKKRATLIASNGATYSVLSAIDWGESDWVFLQPGISQFHKTASFNNGFVDVVYFYDELYSGV